ncbi:MAG: FtsX-like permease family protein [Eubacterium sp.]|nr:FtsX-like permease family protein [Eubacterium sp.]
MENYKELGNRYLRINKKRSLITVFGCFVVASILFMLLNSLVCWVEKCRIDARADDDFEIVILTEDKDTIEKIVNEDFVTSAYLGKAYSWVQEDDKNSVYANVLHINVNNKLLINHYAKYISKTYNVETEMNELLSWTYCQDNEGIGYLMLLGGFFISMVIAIIGVGVLRNNISISAIERVKDYGNLRCIGATKKQIKAIVYRESAVLETIGIVAGIICGFILSIPICRDDKRQYPVAFHIIPVIFLLIAFYGDMYFAVGDGLKKVLSVSPSEAVRGNYRIKARGIKRRRSGVWGLIFGVEGDYAYKNIKRNNGRFIKTVSAMAFGMIIVIVASGWLGVFYTFYKNLNVTTGYYQQYLVCDTNSISTYEEQKADLYSPEALKKITSAKGVEDFKFTYQSTLYTAEDRYIFKNINEEYNKNTIQGSTFYGHTDSMGVDEAKRAKDKQDRKAYRDLGKGLVDYENAEAYNEKNKEYDVDLTAFLDILDTSIDIYGYDPEDYARYKDNLIDGTCDLSENGVLLLNNGLLIPKDAYEDNAWLTGQEEFAFTDFKVGDEIKIVDPSELYKLVQEERKNADVYDRFMREEGKKWEKEHEGETDRIGNPVKNPYSEYDDIIGNRRKESWIINSAREKLVEEGKCRTLVIEGIVNMDPNRFSDIPVLIVPVEHFYDITGKTESDYNGMRFHISNIFSKDLEKPEFLNAVNERQILYYDGIEEDVEAGKRVYEAETSSFLEGILSVVAGVKTLILIALAMVVIIMISILNTMNVNISSLQMRRNEFAQLRSIGMTRRSLLKVVLLEGGIVWIISTIVGLIIGLIIEYWFYTTLVTLLINSGMYICWPAIIITALLSLVVLCGSNYIFFKQMKLNVAESLTRSGE